jgi:hypothetical protein
MRKLCVLPFSEPGNPREQGCGQSFNSWLREERLDEGTSCSRAEAKDVAPTLQRRTVTVITG